MVLSNKKLKQKLRAELLAKSAAGTAPNSNTDSNSQPQSLRVLLDSATQNPRLSKREKRRKTLSLLGPEALSKKVNDVGGSGASSDDAKSVKSSKVEEKDRVELKGHDGEKKKRKMDGVQDGAVNDGKVSKKKLENKKRKGKKRKKRKNEEEKNKGTEEQETMNMDEDIYSQVNNEVAKKVYVGGIPYHYTEDDIRHYFESCGSIVEVDCMKFSDTRKFRGIAFLTFNSEDAAKRALALDKAEMSGMQLTIQPYKSKSSKFAPQMVEGYNRIYVGNLSWDITEDDLTKFFSDCDVSSIRFGMDKETGEFRGYAHVDFSDSVSVAMALKLDQEFVCGRPIKISCAVPLKEVKPGRPVKRSEAAEKEVKTQSLSLPKSEEANEATNNTSTTSGKMRRRKCYECGEKGHAFSDCPKKQTTNPANSNKA